MASTPNPTRYHFGFTAASLRPELARILAEVYLATGRDWEAARAQVLESNALQARSTRSAVILERELRQRLVRLSEGQVTLLAGATAEDRAALGWLAAMKQSAFLFEFAAEVLRDKLEASDPVLRPSDYERFAEAKAALHPEFARLTASSRAKVREVLLRMLREAGLLAADAGSDGALGTAQRPVLSPLVRDSIAADDPRWLAGFLVPDPEIAAL